jgi:hypothetical protein
LLLEVGQKYPWGWLHSFQSNANSRKKCLDLVITTIWVIQFIRVKICFHNMGNISIKRSRNLCRLQKFQLTLVAKCIYNKFSFKIFKSQNGMLLDNIFRCFLSLRLLYIFEISVEHSGFLIPMKSTPWKQIFGPDTCTVYIPVHTCTVLYSEWPKTLWATMKRSLCQTFWQLTFENIN